VPIEKLFQNDRSYTLHTDDDVGAQIASVY
jgi:hypothetical protein